MPFSIEDVVRSGDGPGDGFPAIHTPFWSLCDYVLGQVFNKTMFSVFLFILNKSLTPLNPEPGMQFRSSVSRIDITRLLHEWLG